MTTQTSGRHGAPPEIPDHAFIRHLGSGGFADVYLYEKRPLGLKVAVKVLGMANPMPDLTERFIDEAAVMAQLQHRHIAQVMGSGTAADGRPYIVMKYYAQPNLAVRARREQFSVAQVLSMGVQLASAVETAHRAGILHRDIKPANVLTDQYGDIGLTDFGLASRGVQPASESDGVSVPWSPVEVLYGSDDADQRSDVFALSATLWHLLAGRSPFERADGDNSQTGLMRRIRAGEVTPLTRNDVPESLIRTLRWGMAVNRDARPDSALTLARSLQAIEQELKFAPTPILILDDEVDDDRHRLEQTGPRTNPRTPIVDPQPRHSGRGAIETAPRTPAVRPEQTPPAHAAGTSIAEPWIPPVSRGGPPAPRPRAPVPAAPGADSTVRPTPQVEAQEVVTAPTTLGVPPRYLVAALGAVVVIGATVGVVLATNGGGSPHDGAGGSTSPTQVSQDALPGEVASAPTKPNVTTTQHGDYVRFQWTYSTVEPGDKAFFTVVRSAGSSLSGSTTADHLRVFVGKGSWCLEQLQVRRTDGQESPTAGGTCK